MRKRYVGPFLACFMLAAPASASAHARSATVALDYRLVLDDATKALRNVHVEILDGDRALRVAEGSRTVVVLGVLREPMLRIDRTGAWANRASPTAAAEKLVQPGRGWKRVGGSSFAWHDHRLAPPPYRKALFGPVARFHVPFRIDGRAAEAAGTFVRYRRPTSWPWLAVAAAGLAAAVGIVRVVPAARTAVTTATGVAAALAAIASLAAFGVADSPTGRVAWVEITLAAFVALAAGMALLRSRNEVRVLVATLLGAAAASTTLGSLGVFRHAVVISAFSPLLARSLCAIAFIAGTAAAATGLLVRERHG